MKSIRIGLRTALSHTGDNVRGSEDTRAARSIAEHTVEAPLGRHRGA